MNKFNVFFGLLMCIFISCNKSSDFGQDLVSDGSISYFTTDSFELKAVSIPADSVRMYVKGDASLTLPSFLMGKVYDPAFGSTEATFYAQFQLGTTYNKNLQSAQIDSVIWKVYASADTLRHYGKFENKTTLEVFRITQDVNIIDTLYAHKSLTTDNVASGSLVDYKLQPMILPDTNYIRIPLNEHFHSFIKQLPDSSFISSVKLQEVFEGLSLKMTGEQTGLYSINPSDGRNSLMIYFKETGKTTQDSIRLTTGTNTFRHTHIQHNISNSAYEHYLSNPSSSDQLFIQSMGGAQIKIELPDMKYLKGYALNFAELELTISSENGKDFRLPEQMFLFKKNSTGQLIAIKDGVVALSSNLLSSFGGNAEEFVVNGQSVYKYKMRLPLHLLDYIDGIENNELYISVLYGGYYPARAIINSPDSQANPMKLKLIVTKVQ